MNKVHRHIIIFIVLVKFTLVGSIAQDIPELIKSLEYVDTKSTFTQLTKFNASAFTDRNKSKISSLLATTPSPSLLRLAGFLQLKEALQAIDPESSHSVAQQEALHFALARAGDQGKINVLMNNVRQLPVDDDFVYDVVPNLIYVRQREVMDYILDLILIEDNNCSPADAETEGSISCDYRLMEYVAPVILDFPYRVTKAGGLDAQDYRQALVVVRQWIREHKNTYLLNTEKY